MKKADISLDFTISDIHKIRENNFYQTKDMSIQEKMNFYNAQGEKVQKEIEKLKSQKMSSVL